MPIDPSIALQVRPPQFESPVNQLANVLKIQGMQQEQGLNRLKMDDLQRTQADENQLRDLTMQSGGDMNKLRDLVYRAGNYKQGMALDKTIGERKTTDLTNQKSAVELQLKTVGLYRDASQSITDPQTAAQFLQTMHADPRLKDSAIARVPIDQAIAQIPQDPAQFEAWKKQFALGATEFIKLNAPKVQMQDTGGTSNIVSTPGLGGAPTVLSSTAKTQTPDSVASVASSAANARLQADTSTANNKRSVGASYANAAAVRATADATRDAAKIKGDRDTEMKLADDYRAQSKPFKEVSDAYRTINATLDKATTSAAATLAGATKFMKLLDPGSVVRESELGMALAASGVLDRAFNYHNTLKNGKVLTPSQAADFKRITQQIYAAAQDGQKQVDDNYRRQAQTYGLRPEMIVQDLGQNTRGPVGLDELPAGGGKVVDFGSLK